MKNLTILTILIVSLLISLTAYAQGANEEKRIDSFSCLGKADALNKDMNTNELKIEIENRINALKYPDAHYLCVIAELMKRTGNYKAEEYYEKAINADETEPAYELFYADYLRNFRGAQHPLFPEAEEHYFKALKKLEKLKPTNKWKKFDHETKIQVERGLTTLYQEDGFPIDWESNIIDSEEFLERPPFVFLSTINNYAKSTTDFDEVDDVRNFTSEALFASSEMRLNRDLTKDELKGIIRTKEQFETLNRLRFRYGHWPAFDIFYKYREIDNAQITNFYEPDKFNDVNLNEYGVAIEKPLNFSPDFDLFLSGIFKRTRREGIIEFLSDKKEDIDHYEAKAVISRFFGPNKANLEFIYVFQDIDPDIPNPPERDRQIFGSTLTYQIFTQRVYKQLFEPRGVDLFGGIVMDKEKYGNTIVKKNDFFVGGAFKGLSLIKKNAFDITIQPTIFTYEVDDDKSRDNSQYRTNVTMLYRIKDEEVTKKGFVHLVIPFRHDIAIDGPGDFENFKIGIGLNTKIIWSALRRTTFLISASYDYQRFYELDKNLNLFSLNISMGF
jgi:hypothetical protein